MELRVGKCPACGNTSFEVQRLGCTRCGTAVEGHFTVSKLASLPDEQVSFVETFIKCRGNIKEVERELGISYPTVRSRLDKVIAHLGFATESSVQSRKQILEALERNEMRPEEAVEALKGLRE
ncbi:MAG: DUF2089 domain-containing protein [Spirochaetales bacterium]